MKYAGQLDFTMVDLEMPDVHGFQVANELVRRAPGIQILHMSARIYRNDWAQLHAEQGSPRFLQKPFGLQECKSMILEMFPETRIA